MAANAYRPIACATYDELSLYVLRQQRVVLEIVTPDASPETVTGRIADLYTRGTEEYLRLESGREIRLDHVQAVTEAEA